MKRRVLGLLVAATLAGSGLTLAQSGRFTPPSAGPAVARDHRLDPLASDAGRRFTHNQPRHWRDLVLAH